MKTHSFFEPRLLYKEPPSSTGETSGVTSETPKPKTDVITSKTKPETPNLAAPKTPEAPLSRAQKKEQARQARLKNTLDLIQQKQLIAKTRADIRAARIKLREENPGYVRKIAGGTKERIQNVVGSAWKNEIKNPIYRIWMGSQALGHAAFGTVLSPVAATASATSKLVQGLLWTAKLPFHVVDKTYQWMGGDLPWYLGGVGFSANKFIKNTLAHVQDKWAGSTASWAWEISKMEAKNVVQDINDIIIMKKKQTMALLATPLALASGITNNRAKHLAVDTQIDSVVDKVGRGSIIRSLIWPSVKRTRPKEGFAV